jgi:hypothetical protein
MPIKPSAASATSFRVLDSPRDCRQGKVGSWPQRLTLAGVAVQRPTHQ